MNERNVRIAFAFEGFRDLELKDDPRYVRWIFRQYYKSGGEEKERLLSHHKCTDEDYAQFYEIETSKESTLNRVKESDSHSFLCLDWDDDEPFTAYGIEADGDYSRLETMLVPCNYLHNEIDKNSGDTIPEECITDAEE